MNAFCICKPIWTCFLAAVCWNAEVDEKLQSQLTKAVGQMELSSHHYKVHLRWNSSRNENEAFRRERPSKAAAQSKGSGEFYISGMKVLSIESTDSSSETISAVNERYAFQVVRDKKSGKCTLKQLHVRDSNDEMEQQISRRRAILVEIFPGIWNACGQSVPDLFHSSGFVVKTVMPFERDGEALARVEFEHKGDWKKLPGRVESGFIVFSPKMSWAVVESAFTYLGENDVPLTKVFHTDTLKLTDNGLPYASKHEFVRRLSAVSGAEMTSVRDIDLVGSDFSDDVFTLSYYQLPEPKLKSQWQNLKWWIIGLGLLGTLYPLRKKLQRGKD